MPVWDIANKDILQILRDRKTLFFLILMPLIFTAFLGFLFTGGGGAAADNRLPLGILNQDQGSPLSASLLQALETSNNLRLVDLGSLPADQATQQVADGTLAGVLVIPAGFSAQAFSGTALSPQLVTDAGNVNSQGVQGEVSAALTRVNLALETASLSANSYAKEHPFMGQADRQAYLAQGVTLASAAWANAPVTVSVESATGKSSSASGSAQLTASSFNQSSPGMIVQFAIYGLLFAGGILVSERNSRSLQRLLTTPVSRWQIIAGHVLACFLVVMAQEAILIAFGQFLFKVDYLRQPAATLAMVVAVAIWGASLGLLIGVVSKREEHVVLWSLMAMFILAGLGGAWFPLDVTGKTFSAIGHLLPSAWAMDGFQNIILRGLGFGSVLLPAGILLAYTLLFFGISIWRFRTE